MTAKEPLKRTSSSTKKSFSTKSPNQATSTARKPNVSVPARKPASTQTPVYLRFVYGFMLLLLFMGSFARIARGKNTSSSASPAVQATKPVAAGNLAAKALTFRRTNGADNTCDELTITTSGQAVLMSCESQVERQYQLSDAELQQLSGWISQYQSFDSNNPAAAQPNAAATSLIFNGHGAKTPTDADIQTLRAFAAAIDGEISKSQ